ncbi:MAG TPA: hypothetical protein VLA50_08055 [Erythrobacter sp.]|nr:hypothetical protein [Erythrobacter sp.]
MSAADGWSRRAVLAGGAAAVGSVIGLGGFAGGVGGMIMAASVGAILDVTGGNYTVIFAACTVVYFLAVAVIHLLAPKLARVESV